MKRSFIGFGLAGLLGLGVALTAACSSSSTPSVSTACNYSSLAYCVAYGNLNASQTTQANNSCTSPATITSSCATTGLVGSCSYSSQGLTAISYYYCPTLASTVAASCSAVSGTLTTGSASCGTGSDDAGGGGTPDAGGGTGDAGDAG